MVHKCHICKKEFPFQWKLQRHLERKTPCVEIKNNEIFNGNMDTLLNTYNIRLGLRKEQCDNIKKCLYCLKEFSKLNLHKNCKLKMDETRNLEIDLDICYTPISNYCRFCNQSYATSSSFTRHIKNCKNKIKYTNILKSIIKSNKEKKEITNCINNITNNITNNISVNFYVQDNKLYVNDGIEVRPFGKETLKHLTNERIKQLLDKAHKINETEPEIKFITLLIEEIHRNENVPENYNLEYVNKRNDEMVVYTNDFKLERKLFNKPSFYLQTIHLLASKILTMSNISDDYRQTLCRIIRIIENETKTQINELIKHMKLKLYGNQLLI